MKRGDVWWVSFDPSVGGEIKKKRPAVIISNDAANKHLNRAQVVPLTGQVGHVYPSEAIVTIKDRQRKAMADQLATVSKRRLINKVGELTHTDMRKVEHVVKIQLGLLHTVLQT
jgi:mRNA interferase MazF